MIPHSSFLTVPRLRLRPLAAAMALLENTDLSAREITEKALNIAGTICVFTNQNLTIEEQDSDV